MAYSVRFSSRAAREFRKLPRPAQERLGPAISALADDPRPPNAKKLTGHDQGWRLRIGEYRVLYTIADAILIVMVFKVGHRREVYRRP